MGAVETIVDAVTDNRTYYNCPSCGRRVWAYGSFVGNVCWNCPGTLAHAAVKTTDLVTAGMTSTIIDAAIDNRTEYICPRCGCKKWAYGAGIGRTCLDCLARETSELLHGNFGDIKNWFNMAKASEMEVDLDDFLDQYYNELGTVVKINGKTFTNVVPKSNLTNAKYYDEYNEGYTCGLNAVNICLKIWDYTKQLCLYEYEYDTILGHKIGEHYTDFYNHSIEPYFTYCSWKGKYNPGHINILWSYIDDTDFKNYSLIIMGGQDFTGHYTVVLGVDTEKRHYLIMDQSLKVWLVDTYLFEMISTYKITKSFNVYSVHSVYRVG